MDKGVLDLEWNENHPDKPLLALGWRDESYQAYCVPDFVRKELANPNIIKIAFTKADHRWLNLHGWKIDGPLHDIQTMAWALEERQNLDLESVSRKYGVEVKDKRIIRKGGQVLFTCDGGEQVLIGDAPIGQLLEYNRHDLRVEGELYEKLLKLLEKEKLLAYWYSYVVPFSDVLVKMEATGLPISVPALNYEADSLKHDVIKRERELKRQRGLPEEFNFASNPQMMNLLYLKDFAWETRYRLDKEDMVRVKAGEWPDALPRDFEPTKLGREYVYGYHTLKGLNLKAKDKAPKCEQGKCGHVQEEDHLPSVSTKTMKVHYAWNPWVSDFIEYKGRNKALQFLTTWKQEQVDGYIYGQFKQTGTKTGRISSSSPNLQQIPSRGELGKKFRSLFKAPEGYMFLHGDFSQIEARLMAHFSLDPAMLAVFNAEKDIYEETTVALLGERYPKGTPERDLIKMCFLALGYGAKPRKIHRSLLEAGVRVTFEQVQEAYAGIQRLYGVYWTWKDWQVDQAEKDGYVTTLAGHRRRIDWITPDLRWKAENQAVNSLIQGSAADIAAQMMVNVATIIPTLDPCAAVHDEALWLVLEEYTHLPMGNALLTEVKDIAEHEHGFKLNVPIVFDPAFISDWGAK